MAKASIGREFTKGILRSNPILSVAPLGLCPTLAVTTSLKSGLAMAVAATSVLICSNIMISLTRRVIPREIRIPCFIVIIATFVTIVELVMKAYLPPALNKQLGIFIPLIVVNCIIMGRAEAFASQHTMLESLLDACGIGAGFVIALAMISGLREASGNGSIFGIQLSARYAPASIMIMAPGAFLVVGYLLALFDVRRRAH